jgi:intein/homing endonuclease
MSRIVESASRPLVDFGELNDTTIKRTNIWAGIHYHINGFFVIKYIESNDIVKQWVLYWLSYVFDDKYLFLFPNLACWQGHSTRREYPVKKWIIYQ